MKRKIGIALAIFLFAVLVVELFVIFRIYRQRSDERTVKVLDQEDVSRFEWLEMLCGQNGLTEYQKSRPYFDDVDEENPYFSYVQAAVEWELLQVEDAFAGDEYASGRFIAMTALKSVGENRLRICLDMEGQLSDADYVELAISYGLLETGDLQRSFSRKECEEVLDKLAAFYYGELWEKDICRIAYQKGVTEVDGKDIRMVDETFTQMQLASSAGQGLASGDIIVFEKGDTGLKMARRIVRIDASGVMELEEVDVSEVLESLTVSEVVPVSFENIRAYYGLTQENVVSTQRGKSGEAGTWQNTGFSPTFHSDGFKISLQTQEEGKDTVLTVDVTDNNTGVSYRLPIRHKVSDGSLFQAEVDVDKIQIGAMIDYTVLEGVKSADLALDTHTSVQIGISTEESTADDAERLLLFQTQAPIGNGFLGVDIQIYLVISLQGEISFEAQIPVQASVHYEKGKGVRNLAVKPAFENPTVHVNCEADIMLRTEPVLVLLLCKNVLDAEADVGVAIDAELFLRSNGQMCVDAAVSYPILQIAVCGDEAADSLVGALGLSAQWELIAKEDAPIRFGLHYEVLPDGTSQFVDVCTFKEQDADNGNAFDEGQTPDTFQSILGNPVLNNSYHTRYGEVNMVTCPAFAFDYPDTWTITLEDIPKYGTEESGWYDEKIILSNARGCTITYVDTTVPDSKELQNGYGAAFGSTRMYTHIEVTKAADASFTAGYADGTDSDFSYLGNFMVGRLTCVGGYDGFDDEDYVLEEPVVRGYAVIPESYVGSYSQQGVGLVQFYPVEFVAFPYVTHHCFVAEPPLGEEFTKEEEREVIAILSSFRVY